MPNPLDLDSRRAIYQHLLGHPGKYLRELQRDLGMSMGSLEYQLDRLVAAGLLSVRQDGNKRFFPTRVDARDKAQLAFLRQMQPRHILLWVLEHGPCPKSAVLRGLDLASSTANYHLHRLVTAGLLERTMEGRDAMYRVADPERLIRLLVTYRTSLLDRMVDRLVEGAESMRRA